jgi:uncharacterized membrane protein YbhN (UPF0104 family)
MAGVTDQMHKETDKQRKNWSWRLRVAGTVLSLILLVWLLWQQDWIAIMEAIQALPLWIFIVGLAIMVVRHMWNTTRWLVLMRAQKIPIRFTRAFQLVFAGLFVSNFLPSMVGGDVVRISGILQESENRVAGAASVVVDRLVGVFGMLFVLPFSAPLLNLILTKDLLLVGSVDLGKSKFSDKIRDGLKETSQALRIWLGKPLSLVLSLLASWLSVFSYLCCVLLLAKGIGIPVNLMDIAGATALTYFITMIPLSINGYGIRELAVMGFYTHFGASTEQATVLALTTRFLFLLVSLPGFLWVGKVMPGAGRKMGKTMRGMDESDIEIS